MTIIGSKLFLTDFELLADIGIHDFEKQNRQRVLISVEIDVAVSDPDTSAHGNDEISDVLDYDFLRNGIARLVEERRYNLQETLCREIVRLIASRPEALGAAVSVRKPDVYGDCAAVGVALRYRRDD